MSWLPLPTLSEAEELRKKRTVWSTLGDYADYVVIQGTGTYNIIWVPI